MPRRARLPEIVTLPLQRAGRKLRRHDDRLARVEVRHEPRPGVGAAGPVDVDVGQRGALELAEERGHLLLHFAHVADERERAAAELRRLRQEERVGRRADADREEAPVAELVVHQAQDLVLVADRAIGEEHDLPHERRFARRRRSAILSAGSISVPPRARKAADELLRARSVAGSTGIGAANSGVLYELNSMTLKRSPGSRRSSAISSASRACVDRHAFHRARRVDDVRDLARHARRQRLRRRRRQRHQQRVGLVALGLGEQRGAGRGADVGRPREFEVARRRHRRRRPAPGDSGCPGARRRPSRGTCSRVWRAEIRRSRSMAMRHRIHVALARGRRRAA